MTLNLSEIDKTKVAKEIVSAIVAIGVGKVIGGIIANNTDKNKAVDRITTYAAGYVIGKIISDKTKTYTDAQIDKIVAWWQKVLEDANTTVEETTDPS